jgi:hypothetical protein
MPLPTGRGANERQRVSHSSGAAIKGVPASERVGESEGERPWEIGANERQRVSHASGAGITGVPASERVGESEGQSPSEKEEVMDRA